MKAYAVAKAAHDRGYGNGREIVAVEDRQRPQATAGEIVNSRKSGRRKTY
jgi:hypothetical protein